MKRFLLLAVLISLCKITVFGQKKYEMVVEKTDGTEVVFNVEDIVRTYFRERSTTNPDEPNLLDGPFPVGRWKECDPDGTFMNDATDYEVMHVNIYSDGTGDFWSVSKGKVDEHKYSFKWSININGTNGTFTETITASNYEPNVGQSITLPFTYENGIFHIGEIYYKKIDGETGGEVAGDENVYATCPDDNHPHAIDLGLPSGTKWACCNVGANTPEAYGNYYAWGEILPKNAYTDATYQHYQDKTWIDIGSDIAGTIYDTATANWGELWRMPTKEQCEELKDNCSIVWTTVNGVNGRVFTGVNGQAVFLPAAGVRQGISLKGYNQGLYRSSTSSGRESAWILYFAELLSGGGEAIDAKVISAVREWGYPVRPVR